MNSEDIIRMAREIGLPFWPTDVHVTIGELERFFALAAEWGAKQEREACAKVCDEVIRDLYIVDGDASEEVRRCAKTIRSRGEVKP